MASDLGAAGPTHLVLVTPSYIDSSDFKTIARLAREIDPRVRPTVLKDRRHRLRRIGLARRRTMVFSPLTLRHFRPLRGRVFQGKVFGKSDEYRQIGTISGVSGRSEKGRYVNALRGPRRGALRDRV